MDDTAGKRKSVLEHAETNSYIIFDSLVKSNSLEINYEECDYVARNSARLKSHKEVKHWHEYKGCGTFGSDKEFNRHNELLHENTEEQLPEETLESLTDIENYLFTRHTTPTMPRKKQVESYNLRRGYKNPLLNKRY